MTILLVSRIARDGAVALKAWEFWGLVDQIDGQGELLGRPEDDLTTSGLAAGVAGRS